MLQEKKLKGSLKISIFKRKKKESETITKIEPLKSTCLMLWHLAIWKTASFDRKVQFLS